MATTSGKPWTADNLPDLSGKTILVTGGNSGIGYEAALQFARKGAKVVLACRNLEKAHAAAGRIAKAYPDAAVEVMELDLASLASVRTFAKEFHRDHRSLDILCNNAGVMGLRNGRTADGFETQFGTNHLGHFALTGLLLDLLLATGGARIVTVGSPSHRFGKIGFDDLNWERRFYGRWRAYGQSKLANLMFAFELQRMLAAAGAKQISVACHPGYAATNLPIGSARAMGRVVVDTLVIEAFTVMMNTLFAQSAAMGALPTLYAATSPEAHGGDYIGPGGMAEMWGYPVKVSCTAAARDPEAAKKLWEISEQLTGVTYDALKNPSRAHARM
jgi:NAD(P)-dependent dehydrogenase (short-subunit alcohol dehydrogenase family)